jgi:hypothetical protein
MWAISECHMEYDELLAMPENINTDEDVADRLVEMYFDVVPEPIQEGNEIKCDICGCAPSIIIRTEFGTFCKSHARYT